MDGAIAPAAHIAPSDWARLAAFRREVEAALPGRVRAVILFGSRARGDAAPDSGWDVAVFVAGLAKERTAVRPHLAAVIESEGVPIP